MSNAVAIRTEPLRLRSHPQLIEAPPATEGRAALYFRYGLLAIIMMSAVGTFFRLGLATPLWLLSYCGVGLLALLNFESFSRGLVKAWPAVIFAVFCLASTLWSVEPQATIKNSAQLIVTAAIGVWMGSSFNTRQLLTVLAIAMLVCLLGSLANIVLELIAPFKEDDYVGAERYFIGLYPQKNLMGNVVYLSALGVLYLGIQYRKVLLAYLIVAALLPVLIITKSTTSLLMFMAALSMPIAWWFFSAVQRKLLFLLFCLVPLLAAAFVAFSLDIPIVNEALGALGKDSTLTGRTVIWSTAFKNFDEAPFLGVGYQAFWNSSKFLPDVMLIRAAILETIAGFHNGHLEVAVATGMVGLFFYWFMILSTTIVCLQALIVKPSPALLATCYFVLLTIFRSFVESAVYYQHDLDYLMFCAFLAAIITQQESNTEPVRRRDTRRSNSLSIRHSA